MNFFFSYKLYSMKWW